MLESLLPLAMATHKMCPSLSSTSQKHHVCQMRLILPWSVVGTEGERFTLYLLCKNIMFLEVTRQAAVGGHWKNSSARLGVNTLPIVFELEPCHRNERKKCKVLEVANLGHSLQLGWCLYSGRGHVGWKDLSSPLQPWCQPCPSHPLGPWAVLWLQPCEHGAGGIGRKTPRGCQGLSKSWPPTSGIFPPPSLGMSASTGTRRHPLLAAPMPCVIQSQ